MPRKYLLQRQKSDERDYLYINIMSDLKLPPSIDLRDKMPPIYDQGDLGSCSANAGCGLMQYIGNPRVLP